MESGGALFEGAVAQAAQPFLAVLLQRLYPERPIVVVTEGLKTQESFQQDIETWLAITQVSRETGSSPAPTAVPLLGGARGGSTVRGEEEGTANPSLTKNPPNHSTSLFYPAWEILPHESKLPHADVISERLQTLVALSGQKQGASPIIVTNVVALLQRTFQPGAISNHTRTLKRGDRIDPLDLIEWLEDQGYEPEAQVTQKGEIALRGGIVDVFPLISPWPVRLEFFGDELDSLRYFDPISQISREPMDEVTLPPGGELGILKKLLFDAEAKQEVAPTFSTLLDHLPRNAIFLLCEPEKLLEHSDNYALQVPENDPFFLTWDEFRAEMNARDFTNISLTDTDDSTTNLPPENDLLRDGFSTFSHSEDSIHVPPLPGERAGVRETPHEQTNAPENIPAPQSPFPHHSTTPSLRFASLDAFRPLGERAPIPQVAEAQRREFFAQLHRWLRQSYAVHVFCNNDGERQRFEEIWKEYGFEQSSPTKQGPICHLGSLSRGFLYEEAKLVVITDAEIFGRYKIQRARRLKSPHAVAARSAFDIDFTEMEEGDFVVHLQHGVGRYRGLKILPTAAGRKPTSQSQPASESEGQECLVIEYAAKDPSLPAPRLYVPVTEAHLVSKYVGAGKARPPLNTIGGGRWAKAKEHAERAVRDLAGDLLAIQAARESLAGHSFGPDTPWQREFESAFLFEETPDQMRAITEAKADLEASKPMDRLICGDVGYGKTEVAIRGAFKAVMGGKQVAILVPTTILAQQHFNTFRERMADYPIRVELLSRYRTRREQDAVIAELAAGAVDIVIGTHRLVQSDVEFKDLGLVVIDEEQRFGVLHKEKFKQLRKLVDVLTLSATPIPRTLYLALTGARDMSTISTPPHDRLPIETIVAQYDERTIRDAIQRELNREGQVYFLHNRVMTIDAMAIKLRALVPSARIVVGHGQMDSDELEEVMTKFVNGEADVLLSTSIIESGLDIPNANTIIIDRADRFGLSELYQLRGRVGRYKHQAYAYLLLPRHTSLLADVRKRMSAIKQYSTLGSGFKIAMRDLELRGAGNLLGSQQSGHITAVGFELYCQLLKQSVSTLKGEKVKPRLEVEVRLDFLALNPGEETARVRSAKTKAEESDEPDIQVPREVDTYLMFRTSPRGRQQEASEPVARTAAYIPFKYIGESKQRIEIYRKLAQVTEKAALDGLEKELRDRFGPLPPAMELLLLVTELKLLASDKSVTVIETKEDKLMLTRNNDLILLGGKFPRLKKKEAKARLKEIKKLLLAL